MDVFHILAYPVNAQVVIFNAINPFVWIALGIAAVVAGIYLLIKHWDAVVGRIKESRDLIAVKLVQSWMSFWAYVSQFFTAAYWQGLWQNILQFFQNIWQSLSGFFQTAFSGDFWAGLWQGMIDSFMGALKKLWDSLTGWWDNIQKLARGEKVESPAVEIET